MRSLQSEPIRLTLAKTQLTLSKDDRGEDRKHGREGARHEAVEQERLAWSGQSEHSLSEQVLSVA